MRVRFALIPYHTFYRIFLQWQYAAFIQIARLVGVTAKVCVVVSEVLGGTSSHPVLYKVVVKPVLQYGWKACFKCITVYPCFGWRPSYGVANQPNRYFERISQHTSVVISYGREPFGVVGRSGLPCGRTIILQMIQWVETRSRPCHIVCFPTRFHIEESQLRVAYIIYVSLISIGLAEHKRHIRLSRT